MRRAYLPHTSHSGAPTLVTPRQALHLLFEFVLEEIKNRRKSAISNETREAQNSKKKATRHQPEPRPLADVTARALTLLSY